MSSHGDYSCFQSPVDLSLSGSQLTVSPPRKPSSARSSKMSSKDSPKLQTNRTNQPKRSHVKPSLAMSFPAKENRRPKQTNLSMSMKSSSEDPLSSFFNQPPTKARSKKELPKPSPKKIQVSKLQIEERVFKIPETARSDDTTKSFEANERLFGITDQNTSDLDYLKSYLSNVEKYTNGSTETEDLEETASSVVTPRVGFPTHYAETTEDFDESTQTVSSDPVESFEDQRDRAARKIQSYFRKHSEKQKNAEAEVKKMLATKKEEMERSLQNSLRRSQRSEEEKKLQRKLKAREAHRKAVEDLAKQREEKMKVHVQEEMEIVKQRQLEAKKRKKQRERNAPRADTDTTKDVTDSSQIDMLFEGASAVSSDVGGSELVDGTMPFRKLDDSVGGEGSKSRTTLDDVLETIKILEEQPDQLKETMSTKSALDEKLSWIDEMQSESHSTVSKHSSMALAQANPEQLMAEAKLHSIINYLDDVEMKRKSPVPQEEQSTQSVQQLIQAEQAATEVTSQMLKVKLELEEKTKSVALLQKALVQQRELSIKQLNDQDKEMHRHLKAQKDQYESTIQRHLTFIDQLIEDKKVLSEKCQKLVKEMKHTDERYQNKIKQITQSHEVEMKKSKDVMAAAEKIRREKWIDEKTKKIKEMTVKGLEPEIQRTILKHKEEIKKLKAIHEAELLRSDERAGQRYIRQNEELREQLEREKEAACTREREIARQRYEKQIEQEEIALQQQRKRLFAEVAEEKERLNNQAARQRGELDVLKKQLEDNSRIASSTLRDEYEKNTADVAKRHSHEMQALRERLEIEKQAWQENYMKKQKERELKEAVRRDRDKEIDLAIHRLEDDVHQQREEMEKSCENRIKRIRDKYEAEMKEVEKSERQTQEKYNNMKVDFNQVEGENLRLQSLCKQKDQEVADMLKIKDKLVEERGNVTEVIRQEFADRLVITEEENKRMKTELSELRARHRLELERINNEKEEELAEVHKRVRQAIIKKEETISQIRSQHEGACKRADHLEALLETQRKKLLGKKK